MSKSRRFYDPIRAVALFAQAFRLSAVPTTENPATKGPPDGPPVGGRIQ